MKKRIKLVNGSVNMPDSEDSGNELGYAISGASTNLGSRVIVIKPSLPKEEQRWAIAQGIVRISESGNQKLVRALSDRPEQKDIEEKALDLILPRDRVALAISDFLRYNRDHSEEEAAEYIAERFLVPKEIALRRIKTMSAGETNGRRTRGWQ